MLKPLELSVIEDHPKRRRDVMHTQRASAKLLHEAGAHYVIALKGNQPTPAANPRGFCVLDDVRTVIGDPLVPVLEHEETNVGHGRVETRAARVSTDIARLAHHRWPGFASVGRIDRTRICKRTGAKTTESQPYLLGHGRTPERLLALSRGHWAEAVKALAAKPVEHGRRALRTTCTGLST